MTRTRPGRSCYPDLTKYLGECMVFLSHLDTDPSPGPQDNELVRGSPSKHVFGPCLNGAISVCAPHTCEILDVVFLSRHARHV